MESPDLELLKTLYFDVEHSLHKLTPLPQMYLFKQLLVLFVCFGISMPISQSTESQLLPRSYKFRTKKLSRTTAELQRGIDSIYAKVVRINTYECKGIDEETIAEIEIQELQLHRSLTIMAFDDLRQLIQQDRPDLANAVPHSQPGITYDPDKRIVINDPVNFPEKPVLEWYQTSHGNLAQAQADKLLEKVKEVLREIKSCERKYELCDKFVEDDNFQQRLKLIEDARKLYSNDPISYPDCTNQRGKITSTISSIVSRTDNSEGSYSINLLYAIKHHLRYQAEACSDNPREKLLKQHARNSHAAWNRCLRNIVNIRADSVQNRNKERAPSCEYDFIKSESTRWRGVDRPVDSIWIAEQVTATENIMVEITGDNIGVRGCRQPCALNYDTLANIDDNISCIGCMKRKALNYCRYVENPSSCTFLICPDTSYWEGHPKYLYPDYDPRVDKLEYSDSLCLTPRYGCMNSLCDNYNKKAKYDDGSCSCCCSDETAVNYDPDCIDGPPSACDWRGCQSECASNYEPRAREDFPGGSCICDTISETRLKQLIAAYEGALIMMDDRDAGDLGKAFRRNIRSTGVKTRTIARSFDFNRRGSNLEITADIKLSGQADGIRLGVYWHPPIYEVVDSLVEFLYRESSDYTRQNIYQNFYAYICGEADNHPIRGTGISYNTDGSNMAINFRAYRLQQPFDTSPKNLLSYFQVNGPRYPATFTLYEDSKMTNNEELAFVRSFILRNRLWNKSGKRIPEENLMVFFRANNKDGGAYRKISIAILIKDYFGLNSDEADALSERLAELKAADHFFGRIAGKYPVPGTKFIDCPCVNYNEE